MNTQESVSDVSDDTIDSIENEPTNMRIIPEYEERASEISDENGSNDSLVSADGNNESRKSTSYH